MSFKVGQRVRLNPEYYGAKLTDTQYGFRGTVVALEPDESDGHTRVCVKWDESPDNASGGFVESFEVTELTAAS